jgi:hypothetical protein
MYAREAYYTVQEGKVKAILCPRRCNVYDAGWNDDKTLGQIYDWQTTVREHTVQSWLKSGVDEDGRLVAEKEWTEKVLDPWAVRAREQLADYRRWKTTFKVPGSVVAGRRSTTTPTPGRLAVHPPHRFDRPAVHLFREALTICESGPLG